MPWRDNAKLERLRSLMAEHDLDATVARTPDNLLYVTNYWCMKGHDAVVFPRDGEPVLAVLEPQLDYDELLEMLLGVFGGAVDHLRDGAGLPELDRLVRERLAVGGYPGQPSHPIADRSERGRTSRRTRTKAARAWCARAWCSRSSPASTGREAAASGSRTTSSLPGTTPRSSAGIRMTSEATTIEEGVR